MTTTTLTVTPPQDDRARTASAIADFAGTDEHPVINIPFTLIMDGRSYSGEGLSLVSAFATGLSAPQLEGQRRLATLQFNFDGYTVNLVLEAKVESVSSDTGLLALRFVEPTGPHLPQLRYLLNCFVAGELADLDGMLNAVRGSETRQALKPNARSVSLGMRFKQAMNGVAVLGVSLLLAAVVVNGLYQRFFVMEAPGLSVVALDGLVLRAISAGQIDYINTAAKPGEPVFAIRANSGDILTVNMPCACRVVPGEATQGATVLAGSPVIQVVAPDAKPIIKTAIGADALRALVGGAAAEVGLPDGRKIRAKYLASSLPESGGRADELIGVTLSPEEVVPAADLGLPVSVHVIRQPLDFWPQSLKDFAHAAAAIGQS